MNKYTKLYTCSSGIELIENQQSLTCSTVDKRDVDFIIPFWIIEEEWGIRYEEDNYLSIRPRKVTSVLFEDPQLYDPKPLPTGRVISFDL